MKNRYRFPTRVIGRRAPRLAILIVCEGEKTEPNYFRSLAEALRLGPLVDVQVEGEGCGSAPISVVDHAIEARDERKQANKKGFASVAFEEVWCVMDVEAPKPHQSLDQAYGKARANKIMVALSNPCFEYWYILHFERTSKTFHENKEVRRHLGKYITKYEKGNKGNFELVRRFTKTAVEHAKAVIREKHYGEDIRKSVPSTHVHKVVELLVAQSPRGYDALLRQGEK
jgi:hypothetical protein